MWQLAEGEHLCEKRSTNKIVAISGAVAAAVLATLSGHPNFLIGLGVATCLVYLGILYRRHLATQVQAWLQRYEGAIGVGLFSIFVLLLVGIATLMLIS